MSSLVTAILLMACVAGIVEVWQMPRVIRRVKITLTVVFAVAAVGLLVYLLTLVFPGIR